MLQAVPIYSPFNLFKRFIDLNFKITVAAASSRYTYIYNFVFVAGAKCEANTFDGERCVYGALTDDIRNLLRSYKAISNRLMRRDLFDEFLRK